MTVVDVIQSIRDRTFTLEGHVLPLAGLKTQIGCVIRGVSMRVEEDESAPGQLP